MIDSVRALLRRPSRSARGLIPLEAIAADALRMADGALRAVMECPTLAFGIKGEADQRALIDGWAALLNSLSHPLQVVIRSRQLDPARLAPLPSSAAPAHEALRGSYQRLLAELANQRRVLDRRFFVVVPWDALAARGGSADAAAGLDALGQRVQWVETALRRLDLQPRRLRDRELADLLRLTLDPVAAVQPLGNGCPVDAQRLIAPSAFAEAPGSVWVSGRLARTIAVSHYPARLHPGWLGDLQSFEADLDVVLHLVPTSGPSVMAFLERRIAELSSTVRLAEQDGGRGDPYRRAALQDALELQDRIAQGSERVFDASLLLTVWADGLDALDSATRRLEALLGARLLHSRRLYLQMRAGLVSSMPLGIEQVAVRRVLSTTALSATFPFTGTDLPVGSGLLYGINTATRSPVVLDRFALENHNAVVFATSGAGKSYLVKVELARASLAGTRALVVDPEGEYAGLLSGLGATVVPVRPGGSVGLDPFRLEDASPGALSARIATLTTLIDLICGGLRPPQRAAVGEAVSFAFGRAGFAEGKATAGLSAPRLADVQARLAGRAGMDEVAVRLERYVTGPGSWLFQRGGAPRTTEGSTAYVLAGLPEDERAAAMFLVLGQIWTSLAESVRPTLVVVDEAWWLMRHPDTAAFLFRLVKTARKRRAGLTLVTQDVSDVLGSPDGEAVIANSALQILMRQAPQAIPRLAELFRLTRAEQSWLLGARQGEGLLVAQGRRVPFQVIATNEEARLIEGGETAR